MLKSKGGQQIQRGLLGEVLRVDWATRVTDAGDVSTVTGKWFSPIHGEVVVIESTTTSNTIRLQESGHTIYSLAMSPDYDGQEVATDTFWHLVRKYSRTHEQERAVVPYF
jgi:hypothetical protein